MWSIVSMPVLSYAARKIIKISRLLSAESALTVFWHSIKIAIYPTSLFRLKKSICRIHSVWRLRYQSSFLHLYAENILSLRNLARSSFIMITDKLNWTSSWLQFSPSCFRKRSSVRCFPPITDYFRSPISFAHWSLSAWKTNIISCQNPKRLFSVRWEICEKTTLSRCTGSAIYTDN